MSPMYELTTRDGTAHHIDLRRIVVVEKSAEADCSTFYMDPADDDLVLDDDVADPLTEAWLALHCAAIYRIRPLPSCEHKFIDLRRIRRTATDRRTGRTIFHTDPDDHSFDLHPLAGGPLLAAWRAYNAPRPDKAGPGLPAGWEWFTDPTGNFAAYARGKTPGVWCGFDRHGNVYIGSSAPASVVEAVAHRARVGGAS